MRFSRRPLRASVVHVIAAFAPIAGCSDVLDVGDQETQNPPRCATPQSVGCIPPTEWEDATPPDAALPDASPRDATTDATAKDATGPMDAVVVDTQCPAMAPVGGGACARPERQPCDYGPLCGDFPTRSATCRNGQWTMSQSSCNPPPLQCPATAPTEGAGCDLGWGGPRLCDYGQCDGGAAESFRCTYAVDGGVPTGPFWHVSRRCGNPVCPSAQPVQGSPCELPTDASCNYDDCYGRPSTIAKCPSGTWSVLRSTCNPPAPACPALAPAEGSSCTLTPGLACTFSLSAGGSVIGTCVSGKWQLGVADAGT